MLEKLCISTHLGRKLLGLIGTLPTVIRRKTFSYFVVEIFVLTSSYGGGFGTIPAFMTDMFGAYNIGPLHGIILTSVAFGAMVGGITFNIRRWNTSCNLALITEMIIRNY
ncbi:hypothetical protein CCR75_005935 [Bremia lactucae]|uniref:Uncharacterized protein n=1 Tax=Bremia lactucae TaxID=4779 RepID=A0A976IL33_BRELC|nr:hypothetical protein CCR75_005935 [Bremia lactucae]